MAIDVSIPVISYRPDVLFLKMLASIARSDFPKSRYEVVVVYDREPGKEIEQAIGRLVKESGINFRMENVPSGSGLG